VKHGPRQPLILIVEDQDVMRAILREFVQNAFPDCAIVDAADGARAEELCAKKGPQLVLMDVCLPDTNGIELTARLRAQWPELKVIVVSYLGGDTYTRRAHAAGALAYIVKDRLVVDLVPELAGALGVRPSERPAWRG
jgi:DNA-binding NarL/FixJ family response regulator